MKADRRKRDRTIRRLYTKGKSLREVGARVGLTQEGVRVVLQRLGVEVRSRLVGTRLKAAGRPRRTKPTHACVVCGEQTRLPNTYCSHACAGVKRRGLHYLVYDYAMDLVEKGYGYAAALRATGCDDKSAKARALGLCSRMKRVGRVPSAEVNMKCRSCGAEYTTPRVEKVQFLCPACRPAGGPSIRLALEGDRLVEHDRRTGAVIATHKIPTRDEEE